jgi:hypothetical protein
MPDRVKKKSQSPDNGIVQMDGRKRLGSLGRTCMTEELVFMVPCPELVDVRTQDVLLSITAAVAISRARR